jgi:hypothetical protein
MRHWFWVCVLVCPMLAPTLLQSLKTLFLGLCTCLSNVGSWATTESEDIVCGTVYLSVQCWLTGYYRVLRNVCGPVYLSVQCWLTGYYRVLRHCLWACVLVCPMLAHGLVCGPVYLSVQCWLTGYYRVWRHCLWACVLVCPMLAHRLLQRLFLGLCIFFVIPF